MTNMLLFVVALASVCCCLHAEKLHDFKFKDIDGNEQKMDKYKGKVLLIVNVASACGKTALMYPMLQKLYDDYKDKDFKILAFPCNQWLEEPGTESIIKAFVQNLGMTFDFTSKVDVNPPTACDLWKYIRKAIPRTFPLPDIVEWNFSMFLFGKDGEPCTKERFSPISTPETIKSTIDECLNK